MKKIGILFRKNTKSEEFLPIFKKGIKKNLINHIYIKSSVKKIKEKNYFGFISLIKKTIPNILLNEKIINKLFMMGGSFIRSIGEPRNHRLYYHFSNHPILPYIFPYYDVTSKDDRWNKIKKKLNIEPYPLRKKLGDTVLICYGGLNSYLPNIQYIQEQFKYCIDESLKRKYNVIMTHHPLFMENDRLDFSLGKIRLNRIDKNTIFDKLPISKIFGSDGLLLNKDILCCVTFGGSVEFKCVLAGIPIFSIGDKSSIRYLYKEDNFSRFLDDIPIINEESRNKWFNFVSYFNWSLQEIKTGECISHLLNIWNIKENNHGKI